MLKNYFITALRNISRERFFATMNIAGLALGIGCALVIYKVINYELSYDTHHKNYEKVYRLVRENVVATGIDYTPSVPHPLGGALREDFPGTTVAMTNANGSSQITIDNANKDMFQEERKVAFVEPKIFEIFDFEFLVGDKATCLEHKGSVVMTTSLAQKYFKLQPNEMDKAIGKSLSIDNSVTAIVTAVIADIPKNTDFPFEMFLYYKDQAAINPYFSEGKQWNSNSSATNCYLMLAKGSSVETMESLFPAFLDKYKGDDTSLKSKYNLQPLSDIHSSTRYRNYNEHTVSDNMLMSLGIIGLFLIITASINFINLTTAQAVKRSKEIGIRKTLGGNKSQLVFQFLGETILISFIAAFVGLIISELLLVYLEDIIGYRLTLGLLSNPDSLMFLGGVAIMVGLLSGLYPALLMSGMNPVLALKNSMNAKNKSGLLSMRRVLVIIQFSISQVLIIGTLVVSMQLDYFMAKDLGFNKDSIIITALPDNDPMKLELFKNKLLENASISKVAYCISSPLGQNNASTNINHSTLSKDDEYEASIKVSDPDYIDVYGLKLIAGRKYENNEAVENAVVNRKLTELIGFETPEAALGGKIPSGWGMTFNIVGVVEDFHSYSMSEGMENIVMINMPEVFYETGIKFNTSNAGFSDIKNIVKHIESSYKVVFPEYIFDYQFYDEQINENYEAEQNTAKLFQLFAIIAIFIGCLGLYGLVSYISNQKTKEIGIRKVLGASTFSILKIFSMEIIGLILVAFLIAGPLGFISMSSWLDNYVYSIDLSPVVFIISLLVSLSIAIVTIAYKSIMASIANPVLSLKDE